ncbi:MAG: alternative ribosome rescue aminoacyl-tRNA hydrolase ArfB [Bacteroidota bacterium]
MSPPGKYEPIPESEYEWEAIRASGPGGQHVNKVASAIHLRFNIKQSSLPKWIKERLLKAPDKRISGEGIVHIKVSRSRSQRRNLDEAVKRLNSLVSKAYEIPKKRKATRPSRKAIEKRLQSKARRSEVKKNRRKVDW